MIILILTNLATQHTEEHAFWLLIAVISIRQTSEKKATYN
jgi:hypothetical protein